MATNLRAIQRREKRQAEKLNSGKITQEKLMQIAFVNGKNEGMELALGIACLALCEEFGYGQKRIMKFLERIQKESMKMDEEPTKFNVDWYIRQIHEKCGVTLIREKVI